MINDYKLLVIIHDKKEPLTSQIVDNLQEGKKYHLLIISILMLLKGDSYSSLSVSHIKITTPMGFSSLLDLQQCREVFILTNDYEVKI